jgi:hypothetical protein
MDFELDFAFELEFEFIFIPSFGLVFADRARFAAALRRLRKGPAFSYSENLLPSS